jgi:hypothetical protein
MDCAFYGQFHTELQLLASDYSEALQYLATEAKADRNSNASISLEYYRKQGRLLGSACLCNFVGRISDNSLEALMKLSILVNTAMLFEKAAASIQGIAVNAFKSQNELFVETTTFILAQRIDALLTECLALIIEDTPMTLSWKKIKVPNVSFSGCFEAVHHRQLFSINVLKMYSFGEWSFSWVVAKIYCHRPPISPHIWKKKF